MIIPTYAELAFALDELWANCSNDGEAVAPDDEALERAAAMLERVKNISTLTLRYYR